MGDNKKLYDNLLKSGKISESDIGDFATFDSLLKTPDKANVLYKNLRKGDLFTEEEIGDSVTFMSLIEKPVPKVETPETDTEAQSEYQLSFDKKPTLEDWVNKPEKTPQQITAEKTGVSEQFVNVVEETAKKAVPKAEKRFLKYQRNNIYGGFKSTFPEYSKEIDEIVNMMDSRNPELQMQAEARFNQINQSVTLDPRYPRYKNEFVNPTDVTTAAKSIIDDTNGIKNIAEKLKTQIVPERISTELRIGLENYIKGYTELGKRLDQSQQIRELVSKLKEIQNGNDAKLSEEEGILLQALDENIRTHEDIKSKLPKSYDWATSAGYSLGFMSEFILGRGIVSKVAKPVKEILTAGKIGGAASPLSLGMLKLMEAGVQPVLMPSLYRMIAEKRSEGKSLGRSFGEAWDENFKEVISEYMFMSPSDKIAKGFLNKFFKLAGVTLNTESGVKGFIKNMAEEYIEEKVAEIYSAPKDHANFRSFWNQFINKRDNINTFASVAFISGAMSAPIVAMKSYDKVRSDIVLNGLQKRLPKEISGDIDIILKDKKLTNQEIFKLVGETINNRIKDGTIVTDPTIVASDAIKYAVESIKKIVRENVDKATPEEIFDKEIRLVEPTEKKETVTETKEVKEIEEEVKTEGEYFYNDVSIDETEAIQKIDESESLEELNKVNIPAESPLQEQMKAKETQILNTYELNSKRIADLEEAGSDQKRINEIEKEYQKSLKEINAKYEESVQKESPVKEESEEILAEKKTEISESQKVEDEQVIESEQEIETVKEEKEEKVAEKEAEKPVSPAPVKEEKTEKQEWEKSFDEYKISEYNKLINSKMYEDASESYKKTLRNDFEKYAYDNYSKLQEKAFIEGKDVKKKPAWAMTAKEWADSMNDTLDSSLKEAHEKSVREAIKENKPVPQKVLEEQPTESGKERVRKLFGEDSASILKTATSRMGEDWIDYDRLVQTAQKIIETDKNVPKSAAFAEALQYEMGYPDNWDDLQQAINKSVKENHERGIKGNLEAVKRMIDVGVNLPTEIIDFYNRYNGKDISEKQKKQREGKTLFQAVKPKSNFRGFLNKLGLTGKVEGLDKSARVGKINSVSVILQQGDNESEAIIESIRTPKTLRGKGKAQKALTKIINEADKNGITLKLRAEPEEGAKITQQQLIDWYKKNGFVFAEGSNRGIRSPNVKLQTNVSPIGFYSTIEYALDKITQSKGTPDQFKSMLLKNGAKQAEMDWMDFDGTFTGKSVTKQDIQDWIDQNRIGVQEVVKGDKNPQTPEFFKQREKVEKLGYRVEVEPSIYDDYSLSVYNKNGDNVYEDNEARSNVNSNDIVEIDRLGEIFNKSKLDETKFPQYTIPGGQNYKEVLLTMPPKEIKNPIWKQNSRGLWAFFINDKQLSGSFQNESDIESARGTINPTTESSVQGQFKSSHWDEPNVLAHIRFDERTGVNGEKILFIEEIQSDWAQKGKKDGFKGKPQPLKDIYGNVIVEDTQNWEGKVPSMPFQKTDQWVNLALRRMMRYAAENGFDRIAWTTGEQQADRYDLRKKVDELSYEKKQDGTYYWSGRKGGRSIVHQDDVKESELEGQLGKDVAEKIIKGEGSPDNKYPSTERKVLTGDELAVGGAGMKAFYDQIIPSAASKLAKPFGTKIEPIKIDISGGKPTDYADFDAYMKTKTEKATVQSIPVTESMVESVMEGVPLFKIAEEQRMVRAPKKIFDAILERLFGTKLATAIITDKAKIEEKLKQYGIKKLQDLKRQATAWHGTPYDFEKFSTEKIGTGEGAQAFGWGIYFTELEDIAKYYAKSLRSKILIIDGKEYDIDSLFQKYSYNRYLLRNLENLRDGIYDKKFIKYLINKRIDIINQIEGQQKIIKESNKKLNIILEKMYSMGLPHGASSTEMKLFAEGKTKEYYQLEKLRETVRNNRDWDNLTSQMEKIKQVNFDTWHERNTLIEDRKRAERKIIDLRFSEGFTLDKDIDDVNEAWEYFTEDKHKIEVKEGESTVYKVTLHKGKQPREYSWLEWKEPITETQISKIREQDAHVAEVLTNWKNNESLAPATYQGQGFIGGEIYRYLSSYFNSDKEASLFLLRAGIDGIKYPAESLSGKPTRGFNYVVFDENAITIEEKLKFMATTSGEVYGFTTPEGEIYIDIDKININTPIHEYGHLWIGWAKNNATRLFEKGLKLADDKNSPYFKEIWDNPAYSNLREQYESGNKADFLEEVLATAIGDKGEQFVNSKRKTDFKQWLLDLFNAIKKALGISQYTAKQLQDITFDEFTQAVAIELLKGEEIAKKGGTQNAEKVGTSIEKTGTEEGIEGREGGRIRVRDNETDRLASETGEEIRLAAKFLPKERIEQIKQRRKESSEARKQVWEQVNKTFDDATKQRPKIRESNKGFEKLKPLVQNLIDKLGSALDKKMIYPGQINAITGRFEKATTVKELKNIIDYIKSTILLGNGAKYKSSLRHARESMDAIIKANRRDKSKFSDVKAAEEAIKIDLTQLTLEELKDFTKLVKRLFRSPRTPSTEYLHIINDLFGEKQKQVKEKTQRIKDIEGLQQFVDDTALIEITDVESYIMFNRRLNLARKRAIDIFGQLADTPDNTTAKANIEAKIGDIEKKGEEIGGEFQEQLENFRLAYADFLSSKLTSQETKDGIDGLERKEARFAGMVLVHTPISAIRKLNIAEMLDLNIAIDNLRISELAPYTFHDLIVKLNAINKTDKFLIPALSNINKTARWKRLLDRGLKSSWIARKHPFGKDENESDQLLFELMKLQSFRMDLFLGNTSLTKKFGRIFSQVGQAVNEANEIKSQTEQQLYDAYQIFAKGKRKNKFWKFQYGPDEQLGWRKIIGMFMVERRWQSSEYFKEENLTEDNASYLNVIFNTEKELHRKHATDSKSFDEDLKIYNLFLQLARENDAFKKIGDIEVLDIDKLETVLRSDPGIDALIRTIDKIYEDYKGMHEMATLFNGRGVKFGDKYFSFQSKDKRMQIDDGNILNELLKVDSGARLQTGSTYQWTGAKMYIETDVIPVINSYTEGIRRNYFIYPLLRENIKAIRMAADKIADDNIKQSNNDYRMSMLGNVIAKALLERTAMYFKTGKYHKERTMFDILEKGSKKALLAKPAKTVTETTANVIRMAIVMEKLPMSIYARIKENKDFYQTFVSEYIGDKYFSRWADEVNETIYKNKWAEYAEVAADFFITFADKTVGKAMFVGYFTDTFKSITGKEFSEKEYQDDPSYRFRYAEAIDDATTTALSRVEELFNNKNPLSNAQYLSFFNGLINMRADSGMARVFNFLMSFGRNEANQIVDSVRRYRWSGQGSKERIMAKRDILGVVTSNFMYGILRKMMSITEGIIIAQVSGIFSKGGGDDDKYIDEQKQQLKSGKFYWDYATKRIALDLILAGSANIYESAATFFLFFLESTYSINKGTLERFYELYNTRYMDRVPLYGMADRVLVSATPSGVQPMVKDFFSTGRSLFDIVDSLWDLHEEGLLSEKDVYDLLNIWNMGMKYLLFAPSVPIVERKVNQNMYRLRKEHIKQEKQWMKEKEGENEGSENQPVSVIKM